MNLSHRRHTGRFLPHRHTSYSALGFLLLLSVVTLGVVTQVSYSQTISARIDGLPPTVGATITLPTANQVLTTSPIMVAGTCPPGLIVDIERDGVFAGSAACDANGTYNLQVALLPGLNTLIAQDMDGLSRPGPASAPTVVTYNPPVPIIIPPTPTPTPITHPSTSASDLLLSSKQTTALTSDTNNPIDSFVAVTGGVAPYNVSYDWGDGTVSAAKRIGTNGFEAKHTYQAPGSYKILVSATDSAGHKCSLQLAAIITAPIVIGAPTTPSAHGSEATQFTLEPDLMIAWPILILTILMVISFYLGERDEKWRLLPRLFKSGSI